MLRKSKRNPSARHRNLTAYIDEGSEIEGTYTFSGTVLLNGKFQGEIISNDALIIGERGIVNGSIRAGSVVVNGEVVGNIEANERIELRSTARLFGDVEAPVVIIEEGVLFDGHSRMTKTRPPETAQDQAVIPLRRDAATPS